MINEKYLLDIIKYMNTARQTAGRTTDWADFCHAEPKAANTIEREMIQDRPELLAEWSDVLAMLQAGNVIGAMSLAKANADFVRRSQADGMADFE